MKEVSLSDDDRPATVRPVAWHAMSPGDVASRLTVDPENGLDADEVERRLAQYGANELPTEPPPSLWEVARGQLSNPMNIMLLIVSVASFAIGQVATGLFVLGLVTFNVVMGSQPGAQGLAQRRGAHVSSRSPARASGGRRA